MSGRWPTTNDEEGGRGARPAHRGGRHRRCDPRPGPRRRSGTWRALVGGLGLVAVLAITTVVPSGSATTGAGVLPAALATTAAPHGAGEHAPREPHEKRVCDKYGSTPVHDGRYEVQNDLWGASTSQCVIAFDTGFRVEADHHKSSGPASYPSIVFGCNYGTCTKGTPFPRPISDLGDLRSSWATTTPDKGDYNVSYDIWLDPTARKDGRPTGLELMIWLKHTDRVQPIGDKVGETTLDGVPYEVWQGEADVTTISYVRKQPTNSVQNLSLPTFVADAQKRGVAKPTWYLTSVQAGFEPWIGGTGLATTSFSVTRNGQ